MVNRRVRWELSYDNRNTRLTLLCATDGICRYLCEYLNRFFIALNNADSQYGWRNTCSLSVDTWARDLIELSHSLVEQIALEVTKSRLLVATMWRDLLLLGAEVCISDVKPHAVWETWNFRATLCETKISYIYVMILICTPIYWIQIWYPNWDAR